MRQVVRHATQVNRSPGQLPGRAAEAHPDSGAGDVGRCLAGGDGAELKGQQAWHRPFCRNWGLEGRKGEEWNERAGRELEGLRCSWSQKAPGAEG